MKKKAKCLLKTGNSFKSSVVVNNIILHCKSAFLICFSVSENQTRVGMEVIYVIYLVLLFNYSNWEFHLT